jgi:hypothetical protein
MISTDAHGRVVGFAHHDGTVVGVSVENGGTQVSIRLRSTEGHEHLLLLSGVRAFRLDSFREGNIVHAIRLHTVHAARTLFDIPSLVEGRLDLDLATVPSGEFVFVLEPSYGAEVVSVCRDVVLMSQTK